MNGDQRRVKILTVLENSLEAVSASRLAERFGVSRQVIVGDIALLRASDHDIEATSRGYVLAAHDQVVNERFVSKVVSVHEPELSETEFNVIVQHGGEVLDVQVEHPVYGLLTAPLNIKSYADVEFYCDQMAEHSARDLSVLSDGVHIHTIECDSEAQFAGILRALRAAGFLLRH
ncbi:transcription repressor NadR [Fundicoccus sp. Sow4_D5]|uniref:transcription repressor NadR n=1 Tax=Fundicoccus sp. Sow4_D5 TaxID=3438782 RepID=UPI003F8DF87D